MLKQSFHQKDLFPLAISSVLIESITLQLDFFCFGSSYFCLFDMNMTVLTLADIFLWV